MPTIKLLLEIIGYLSGIGASLAAFITSFLSVFVLGEHMGQSSSLLYSIALALQWILALLNIAGLYPFFKTNGAKLQLTVGILWIAFYIVIVFGLNNEPLTSSGIMLLIMVGLPGILFLVSGLLRLVIFNKFKEPIAVNNLP